MITTDLATLYCRFVEKVVNRRSLDHLGPVPGTRGGRACTGQDRRPRRQSRATGTLAGGGVGPHLLIEDLVAERDHLMARLRATGTHRGMRVDSKATRSRLNVLVFETWSVRDGRCVERWLHVDRSQCASAPFGPEANAYTSAEHLG